jgi:hypothetical protein
VQLATARQRSSLPQAQKAFCNDHLMRLSEFVVKPQAPKKQFVDFKFLEFSCREDSFTFLKGLGTKNPPLTAGF